MIKKAREFQKNIYFCFIDDVKYFVWITTNKASEGDGIPAKLLQILKDDSALNMPANLENSAVATGLEKVSFHSNSNSKER